MYTAKNTRSVTQKRRQHFISCNDFATLLLVTECLRRKTEKGDMKLKENRLSYYHCGTTYSSAANWSQF